MQKGGGESEVVLEQRSSKGGRQDPPTDANIARGEDGADAGCLHGLSVLVEKPGQHHLHIVIKIELIE